MLYAHTLTPSHRHQFPTPTTTPLTQHTAGIPAWQRTLQQNASDDILVNGEGEREEERRSGKGETERENEEKETD